MLQRQYPALVLLPCQVCTEFVIDDGWKVTKRRRPSGTFPPCRYAAKGAKDMECPKGSPEDSKALTEQNQLAYKFHRECRATGHWPDDAIVRRNAAIIEEAEEFFRDAKTDRLEKMMSAILGIKSNV